MQQLQDEGKPSSSYNPQSNGIVEQECQVLGNTLWAFELKKKDFCTKDPWGLFLSAAVWAICSTVQTSLDVTPGPLVFGCNMLLPIQLKTDWAWIQQHKEDIINVSNREENLSRIEHEYHVGEKVMYSTWITRWTSPPRSTNEILSSPTVDRACI